MQIQVRKAAFPVLLLAALAACQPEAENATASSEAAAEPAPVPAKPMSMRIADVRITSGQAQNASCNIERANGTLFWPDQPRVTKSQTIEISGWVVDGATQSIPGNVKIRLQTADGASAWEQDIIESVERVDVANNLHNEAYRNAGFKVNLDVAQLAPGDYVIYLAFDKAGAEVVCGIGRRLTLAP